MDKHNMKIPILYLYIKQPQGTFPCMNYPTILFTRWRDIKLAGDMIQILCKSLVPLLISFILTYQGSFQCFFFFIK